MWSFQMPVRYKGKSWWDVKTSSVTVDLSQTLPVHSFAAQQEARGVPPPIFKFMPPVIMLVCVTLPYVDSFSVKWLMFPMK